MPITTECKNIVRPFSIFVYVMCIQKCPTQFAKSAEKSATLSKKPKEDPDE